MTTAELSGTVLEDFKINVKLKLSALWVAVMLCYIYGDIFNFLKPGALMAIIDGTAPGGPPTQGILVGVALSMAVPSSMVFLSLVLKPQANRWTNIVLGTVYTLFLLLTMYGAWYFYIALGVIETALTLLIVWHAWKWPKRAAT